MATPQDIAEAKAAAAARRKQQEAEKAAQAAAATTKIASPASLGLSDVQVSARQAPAAPTGPTITGPTTVTGPTVTGPTVTGPTVTGPTVTGPTVTGPTVTGPTVTGPTGTTGKTYTASDGTIFTDPQAYVGYEAMLRDKESSRLANIAASQSAYDLLYQQFAQYGLGSLVEPLKGFIQQGISPAEFTLRLRDTDAYKKRFAANQARIAKGLSALSEAQYIGLEDQYQNVMRQYGLPESYYAKGDLGVQPGFEKLLANDVSAAELEDRVQTAQNRVMNAAPEIKTALQQFYPDITSGDILAYALDPQNALANIKRKVGAAEIGGAALQAGLQTGLARAEELQKYGVTQAQAQQGYQTIGGGLQRGSELASIYSQSPYTQTTAEQEVFGLPSAAEAQRKRKQLIGLEKATFSGQTGAGGAFERERAGGY